MTLSELLGMESIHVALIAMATIVVLLIITTAIIICCILTPTEDKQRDVEEDTGSNSGTLSDGGDPLDGYIKPNDYENNNDPMM